MEHGLHTRSPAGAGPAPWAEPLREILEGDEAVMLAYPTPADGVVLTPLTNFGLLDPTARTLTVNSSIGAWKKLDRIRRNPRIALAFHTREHARSDRPEHVLAQGTARISAPIDDYPGVRLEMYRRVQDWDQVGALRKRWMRIYARRVEITVAIERVIVWPDLHCHGQPRVYGQPLPEPPPSQRPPAKGTGPRLNHRRAAARWAKLPNTLLGWIGADGLPVAVPVRPIGSEPAGVVLEGPELIPPGSRRAGVTAHSFAPRLIGQHQRVHTGWLDVSERGKVTYAPHTSAAYRFPASERLFEVVAGAGTRWRLRKARRAGVLPALERGTGPAAASPQVGVAASERQR